MKNIRKIIAAVLCAAMILSVCIPFASAEETPEDVAVSQQTTQVDGEVQNEQLSEEDLEQSEEDIIEPEENEKFEEEISESEEEPGESEEEITDTETEEQPDMNEEIPEIDEDYYVPEDMVVPEGTEEEKIGYLDALVIVAAMGAGHIGDAVILLGATAISPVLFLAFPPIGAAAMLAGIPVAAGSFVLGVGEIVASPVIALVYVVA